MLAIAPQSILSWEEEFSERVKAYQANLPRIWWCQTTHQLRLKLKTQHCLRHDWTALVWGWDRITVSKLGLSCNGLPGESRNKPSWKYTVRLQTPCSVGLDDLQRSLWIPNILWFCEMTFTTIYWSSWNEGMLLGSIRHSCSSFLVRSVHCLLLFSCNCDYHPADTIITFYPRSHSLFNTQTVSIDDFNVRNSCVQKMASNKWWENRIN